MTQQRLAQVLIGITLLWIISSASLTTAAPGQVHVAKQPCAITANYIAGPAVTRSYWF